MELPFGLNPHKTDPGEWGASLRNNAEILLALLEPAEPRPVVEPGAHAGDNARVCRCGGPR